MNQSIEQRRRALAEMRARHHPTCPVCSEFSAHGLRLAFKVCAAGGVEAEVVLDHDKEGYSGYVHGGVVASLLDGAMTNCLFSHGIRGVTAELLVRLLHPVQAGKTLTVRARLERRLGPLSVLRAEVLQEGRVAAKGKAKFMAASVAGVWC